MNLQVNKRYYQALRTYKRIMEQTIQLKKDYRDAYYAKALFLSQKAEAEKDTTAKAKLTAEAKDTLNFIINNWPSDQQAKDFLKTLK
jgi:hypothetical protein